MSKNSKIRCRTEIDQDNEQALPNFFKKFKSSQDSELASFQRDLEGIQILPLEPNNRTRFELDTSQAELYLSSLENLAK